jgi:hypothetical protein
MSPEQRMKEHTLHKDLAHAGYSEKHGKLLGVYEKLLDAPDLLNLIKQNEVDHVTPTRIACSSFGQSGLGQLLDSGWHYCSGV